MAFDLPINDVTTYVEDLLNQIGEDCTVDGVSTKIMVSDLQRAYTNLEQNTKQAVLSNKLTVSRGAKVNWTDGKKAIVYTVPNNDIVSYSMQVLMCNCEVDVLTYGEVYDTDPNSPTFGDILSEGETVKVTTSGFIERIDATEKKYDVGILHEAILRLVTYVGTDIQLDDLIRFKGKKYRVIDVDDITDGLLVIQLASVRQ